MLRKKPDPAERDREALHAAIASANAEICSAVGRMAKDAPAKRKASAGLRTAQGAVRRASDGHPEQAALEILAGRFGLSAFERRVLIAAAGMVLDEKFAALVEAHSRHRALTFSFALEVFADAHWTAATPHGRLRRWQLILPLPATNPLAAPLVLDERILHYLLGIDEPDVRITATAQRMSTDLPLSAGQAGIAESLADLWQDATAKAVCPAALLHGATRQERRNIVARAAKASGFEAWVWDTTGGALESEPGHWRRLWEREALLRDAVLLIEAEQHAQPSTEAVRLAESIRGPVALSGGRWPEGARPRRAFRVLAPETAERAALWTRALGGRARGLKQTIQRAALQFQLPAEAALDAAGEAVGAPVQQTGAVFWAACRRLARRDIDDVAERIDARAQEADLVLPPAQQQLLRDLVTTAKHQHTVAGDWGFAGKSARGLGLTALFAGPSGTGKTMAAEVIANALDLDLYRIDLSAIVSKYIGETEKNLRRVFDAADLSGTLLLFDEADALFGKRSEVRDSHDRYANIEVSYLLQRMEAYRGLAILTTNSRQSLDDAFTRRLRFIVQFPFPDAPARQDIWQRAFPEETPRAPLDWPKLARLNVAGGTIRNIALGAAVFAAAEKTGVNMKHLARAARTECAKMERTVAESELAGWI